MIVTCAERVIRRNTHTQLPNVGSYRGNPYAETVNIFSLNSHATSKTAYSSYLYEASYKEKHTHTTARCGIIQRQSPSKSSKFFLLNSHATNKTAYDSYLREASYKEKHIHIQRIILCYQYYYKNFIKEGDNNILLKKKKKKESSDNKMISVVSTI